MTGGIMVPAIHDGPPSPEDHENSDTILTNGAIFMVGILFIPFRHIEPG
jgi:hypothetical protein